MYLFVYEYACAAKPDSNLRAEGGAMLSAIIEDLTRIPDTRVATLLHPTMDDIPNAHCHPTRDDASDFRRLARDADLTLVIAPETGGLLMQRCQWVEQAGGTLLGSPASVVACLADKWRCHEFLRKNDIPTPQTISVRNNIPMHSFPAVCKPRLGAGAQSTFIVNSPAELAACLEKRGETSPTGEFIVQRFARGTPASVLCMAGPKQRLPLMPGEQHLNGGEQIHYLGGSAPLDRHLRERATSLAKRLLQTIHGCRGFIGFDMVLGDDDGGCDFVIEVNPRITTSYLALRKLTESNLADTLLQIVHGETVAPPIWCEELWHYRVGNVEEGVELWPIR